MTQLLFQNPVFREGHNVTVRRGVKWDVADHKGVEILAAAPDGTATVVATVDIETRVLQFHNIHDADVAHEHNPRCHTREGLHRVMREIYPGFDSREIVTIVSFEYHKPQEKK